MRTTRRIAGLFIILLLTGKSVAQELPRTAAETSGYSKTSTGSDVSAFLRDLAAATPRVKVSTIGTTAEGREIPVAMVADPPAATPREAIQRNRQVVLLIGGIHPGECDGKEALLALARELALGKAEAAGEKGNSESWTATVLKQLVVLIVPNLNADGNERRAETNRPKQAGPVETGRRENAQGLDLNRDFVKLESPEIRALVKLINTWDPSVIVDTHTTNGSLHRYPLTYDGIKNPAGDAELIRFVREGMLPAVAERVKQRAELDTFWYGNFGRDHTRWEGYPDLPRYGINWVGLRNRVGILTESYSYATFEVRVRAQESFVREILRYSAENAAKIREAIVTADERTGNWTGQARTAIASKMVAAANKSTVLGYVEEQKDGQTVATSPRDYAVDRITEFAPVLEIARPFAYLIPSSASLVIENLRRHGIQVEILREDIELEVESLMLDSVATTSTSRPSTGRALLEATATPSQQVQRVEAGTYVVRTTQRLGVLATYLLEPQSGDSLMTWNFFPGLKAGATFPVLRLTSRASLLTSPLAPLDELSRNKPLPITFEAAFETDPAPNLNGAPIGEVEWLADGEHYLQSRERKLMKVHAATGRSELFVNPGPISEALARLPSLGRQQATKITTGSSFHFDPLREAVLLEHAKDLYYARLNGSLAVRLTKSPQLEEFPTFSPDGQFVAFVRDNDLWVVDVATQTERALTTGGSDLIRNAKHTWVYFEELYNRNWQAFWWSPDSSRLAYLQEDASPVRTFTIVNDARSGEQVVERSPYPKPGEPNPRVKLLTVTTAGGEPREVDLSNYSPEDMLITKIAWWPDSSALACFVSNRVQTWSDMLSCPADVGSPRRLLRDQTAAWIEAPSILSFLDGRGFLCSSDRSGWQHLYRYSNDGKLLGAVTSGEWEVRGLSRVDEKNGWIYFTGTRDSHIASNLYRVRLDGADVQRLTSAPGSHRVTVSPGGAMFTDSWSSNSATSQSVLRRTADGSIVRRLDINPVPDLEKYRVAQRELVQIRLPDGFVMEGSLMRPHDLDPSKKYPVWLMTYGGPHAPTVYDAWTAGRLFDQALASAGIVVFCTDPRSASGKGAVSTWVSRHQLGVPELKDLEAALDWLCATYPWIDRQRIGMQGHSYGGFLTAYAMTHSDRFTVGISGAPVTDWRDYDSIYTERYMSVPQQNLEGYDATSVVKAAGKLKGRLLLVHGMIDDNVHVQNSLRFVRALQQANRRFELMIYPENRHGIGGRHYQTVQWDFIQRAPGGPVSGGGPATATELAR